MDHAASRKECHKTAVGTCSNVGELLNLLDQLDSAGEQGGWDGTTKSLGNPKIDDKLV